MRWTRENDNNEFPESPCPSVNVERDSQPDQKERQRETSFPFRLVGTWPGRHSVKSLKATNRPNPSEEYFDEESNASRVCSAGTLHWIVFSQSYLSSLHIIVDSE